MANDGFSICPTCGHQAIKRKRPYAALAVIGVAVLLAVIGVGFESGHMQASASVPAREAPTTAEALPARERAESEREAPAGSLPAIAFTSQELHDLFEADEAAANQKLSGSVIEVTGTVKSIDSRTDGNAQIFLETSDKYESTMLDLEASETAAAARLVKGREIKVRCKSANYLIGTAVGHDCVIA